MTRPPDDDPHPGPHDLTGLPARPPVPGTPRLVADLDTWSASLDAGEVAALDQPDADRVVAALLGEPAGGRRPAGRIVVDGRRIDRRGPAGRVRHGLVAVSGAVVAPDVRVLDHLAALVAPPVAGALLATSPLLRDRGADSAGILSGGERRTLAWLRARALAPAVVLLDRAAEGFDASSLAWADAVVAGWRRAGVAVVVRPGRAEEAAWAPSVG